MTTLSTNMLIVFLIAGGITALAMLSVFANAIRHETHLHDLRIRVKELHYQHAMYVAKISGHIREDEELEEGEIEILDDKEDESQIKTAQELQSIKDASTPSGPTQAQSLPVESAPPASAAA